MLTHEIATLVPSPRPDLYWSKSGQNRSILLLLASLFSSRSSCPANPEEKELVEHGFEVLAAHLGESRLRDATVIEPTPAFFPDPWDGSPAAASRLFARVCGFMQIDSGSLDLSFWNEERERPSPIANSAETRGASGYYSQKDGIEHVSVNAKELTDPESLVSTIAHELAHVILLGPSGMPHDEPHMEAITDLATIYLGLGIFTSNTLLRRRAWTEGNREGWSVSRKGYISPEMAGWALSLFAWKRSDVKPKWSRHLATDGKAYLKKGLRYLAANPDKSHRVSTT